MGREKREKKKKRTMKIPSLKQVYEPKLCVVKTLPPL